jgi:hypothetical protein
MVYFSGFGMFGPRKIWQPWLLLLSRRKNGFGGKDLFRLNWSLSYDFGNYNRNDSVVVG